MIDKSSSSGTLPVSLPHRQASMRSVNSIDAVPTEDPRNTTELLADRLSAWKHAVDQLEEYFSAMEKMERAQAKEYEKILKTIQSPLKLGHHFEQSVGGVASLFENMRQNTQALMAMHLESEKSIKDSVLPIMDKLRKEIKNKNKDVATGAVKSVKEIEKARNLTQRHIELLGQNAAGFDASGFRVNSSEDPYVLRRGVLHRLAKQVMEENNHRHELVALQQKFCQFEQHILQVIQTSMESLNKVVTSQSNRKQDLYTDMLGTAQAIPLDFEWNGFISRSGDALINPNTPDRDIAVISFPNQDHRATKPIIEGILERKSRNKLSFSGFSTGFYVVTPSKFLHEFKDDDYTGKDPAPELSIYLPDATIGPPNGDKFSVKGKDVSKGLGSKLSGTPEIHFKAPSPSEARKWVTALQGANSNAPHNPVTNDFSEQVILKPETIAASPPPTYRENSLPPTVHTAETEKEPETLLTSSDTADNPPAASPQDEATAAVPIQDVKVSEVLASAAQPPLGSNPTETTTPESKV